jgi:alpha-galactosidase
VLPRPGELRPVLYNSWEATEFDIDEAGQRALARVAASLGAELFVVDDGWFGARTHDAAGLGDWTVNRERFPGGLRPLIEEVRRLGMGFGLWVEPEMVNPESDLYRRHPDWVVHAPPRRPSLVRHQLVLDFSRDEVAAWAHAWLDRLLAEHEIDFLKWDMNRPFSEVGTPRTWLGHTRNVYAILDRLRTDHPRLRVEGCASGGGRVDAGMLARVDQVWTSDNTDALDRLAIQHGHTQIYPAGTMGAWVTDSPNPLTGRSTPLRFRCHVAMAGVMALGGDLTRWTQEQLREAAGHVAAYKRIRHVVQHGLLYRLRGPNAVQYLLGDEVVVLVYAPFRNHGHEEPPLRLAGIDPDARYRDQVTGSVHHGAVLAGPGLRPDLPPGDHASTLIHLKRQ